jgi:hypothetical protein
MRSVVEAPLQPDHLIAPAASNDARVTTCFKGCLWSLCDDVLSNTKAIELIQLNTMSSLPKTKTTHDPIYSLLNAEEDKERDELTQRWKDNKLQELSFVGIVVS